MLVKGPYLEQQDIVATVQASYAKKKLSLRLLDFQYELQRGEGAQSTQQTCSWPSAVRTQAKTASSITESSSEPVQNFLRLMVPTVGIPEVMTRLEVALTALMNSKGLDLFDIINPEIITRDGFLLLQMDFGFPEHLLVDFLQSLS